MSYVVQQGSAKWADPDHRRITLVVKGDGEADFHPATISRCDPLTAFAELYDQAIGDPPAFGPIGDYAPPPAVDQPTSPPPGVIAPVTMPTPPPLPSPRPIDWNVEAQRFIEAIYTVHGVNVRSSMNIWAAAVALKAPETWDEYDKVCAAMAPKLNDWEGQVFLERDRIAAVEGAKLSDANWPVLPDGAPQFIELCAEG